LSEKSVFCNTYITVVSAYGSNDTAYVYYILISDSGLLHIQNVSRNLSECNGAFCW